MALKEKKCSNCKNVVEYSHKGKPDLCPYCGAKYWDKPKDERDLFLLQDIYVESGRKKEHLGNMYEKLYVYAENIIKHKLRNSYILPEENLKSKANDIALLMVERYLKKPNEKIDHSFGGMMMWIANGVLFGGKKDDMVESLNQKIYSSDKEVYDTLYKISSQEHEHFLSGDPQTKLHLMEKTNVAKEVSFIVDEIYQRIRRKKSPSNLLYLISLHHFFSRKKESFIREFNNLISTKTKRDVESTKLVVRNYLKEQG